MAIVAIGVKEHIVLRHEIEIEVGEGCVKHVEDFIKCIEKSGVEEVEKYASAMSGVEVLDTFIEEVPNEEDVSYETWIVGVNQ